MRTFLFDLFCFTGDLEKAGEQAKLIADGTPELKTAVLALLGMLQAEEMRRKVFSGEGKPKTFLDPPAYVERHLEALSLLARGDSATGTQILLAAEEAREEISGVVEKTEFADIRDCDDVIGPTLEFISRGDYYWVPLEQVKQFKVEPPQQSRDLIWAPARIMLVDLTPLTGYVPTLYVDTYKSDDNQFRLSRKTDWLQQDDGPVRGIGQRTMLVGPEALAILEIGNVRINSKLLLPPVEQPESST